MSKLPPLTHSIHRPLCISECYISPSFFVPQKDSMMRNPILSFPISYYINLVLAFWKNRGPTLRGTSFNVFFFWVLPQFTSMPGGGELTHILSAKPQKKDSASPSILGQLATKAPRKTHADQAHASQEDGLSISPYLGSATEAGASGFFFSCPLMHATTTTSTTTCHYDHLLPLSIHPPASRTSRTSRYYITLPLVLFQAQKSAANGRH